MKLQEFMQEFKRMCWFFKQNGVCPMGCPMTGFDVSQCRKLAFEDPDQVERIVSDWSKRHPKPPTWREWLGSHGITVRCDGSLQFINKGDEDKPVPEALWKQ